jgi:hypothetical protein
MGSGGNWDQDQNLNNGWVEWPTGPLTIEEEETPTWLEAWVVQRTTGASQSTYQAAPFAPGHTKWTADTKGWKQGTFQPGPALGIALLSLHNSDSNTDDFYWWIDEINLTP